MKLKQTLIVGGFVFQAFILSITLYFLHEANQKSEESVFVDEIVSEPANSSGMKLPFSNYVTGVGKVVCSNYTKINVKREGIVEKLFVKEGDVVAKGATLFQIDQSNLFFTFREKLADYETAVAEIKLYENEESREKEIDVLKAVIRKKEIGMQAAEKALVDCKVVAPYEGKVLKININPGEYVTPQEESILIGSDNPLHLKVRIDEKDMWKIAPSKSLRAIALNKANPSIHYILDFLTVRAIDEKEGKLEMLFAFDKGKAPIYLEQTLDVYIEAADLSYLDYQFNNK